MTFYRGQLVVYVGYIASFMDAFDEWRHPPPGDKLELNAVYVVEEVLHISDEGLGLNLVGVNSPGDEYWLEGYDARCFRPAVRPDLKVSFTEGAPKDSEPWDNRRKKRVRA